MAFGGTYYGPGGPRFEWNITWAETGRNGSSVTYRVTAKTRLQYSTSYYGYNLSMKATINGVSKTVSLSSTGWKGTSWRGPWTFDITTSAGSGGGSHSAKFEVSSSNGGASAAKLSVSGTVDYSTWNTAPTVSGCITVRETNKSGRIISNEASGTENVNKFPENVSALYLSWPAASDKEGGTITYDIYRQISESSWSKIASTTSTNYTDNIGSGNQGASYDYYVKARDSYGAESSGAINATQVQKNVYTKATLTLGSATVTQSTSSISRSYKGANNTNGDGTFWYALYCNCNGKDITVYNPANTSSSITIYKSGTAPTTTYIKYSDIKSALVSSQYRGTLTFTLETSNKYGSIGHTTASVYVDLQQDISISDSVTIDSSSYTTVGSKKYAIGNLKAIKINWGAATDSLDQASIRYKLEYSTNNGSSWAVVSGANSLSTNTYTTTISNTNGYTYKFRVTVSNSYGRTKVYSSIPSLPVYYYNTPETTVTGVTRATTKATITFAVTLKSNVPSNAVTKIQAAYGSTQCDEGKAGTITASTRTVNFSGLSETSTFTAVITVTDTVGAALGKTGSASKVIEAAQTLITLRASGVGIFATPDGSSKLKINGAVLPVGDFLGTTAYNAVPNGLSISENGSAANGFASTYMTTLTVKSSTNRQFQISSYNSGGLYYRAGHVNNTGGTGTGWKAWEKIYTTANKPTPADIGAATSSHTHSNYSLTSHTHSNYSLTSHNHDSVYFKLSGGTVTGVTSFYKGSASQTVIVNTSADANGNGDSNTHLGYYSSSKYYHYFRGKGSTIIDTHEGLLVSSGDLNCSKAANISGNLTLGSYANAWRALISRRQNNSVNYDGRYGASYLSALKLTSSSTGEFAYGATIECYNASTSTAVRRFLFGNNAFVPMSDNNTYLGTASHRWKSAYCTEGKFYTSTKSFKTNIRSIDKPLSDVMPLDSKSTVKTTKECILEAIKDTPITVYNYKARMLNNARSTDVTENQMFVGFIADDLKTNHPEFFSLIGESGVHERDILDEYGKPTGETIEEMQYDISDISMLGVLWAGLQEALNKIDTLENEIETLKTTNI